MTDEMFQAGPLVPSAVLDEMEFLLRMATPLPWRRANLCNVTTEYTILAGGATSRTTRYCPEDDLIVALAVNNLPALIAIARAALNSEVNHGTE